MGALQSKKYRLGFTLIEILVVIVILGILVSIVAPSMLNRADDARLQKVEADFRVLETALEVYRLDNYVIPTSDQGLEALVSKPAIAPLPQSWKKNGYMPRMPTDPWGSNYLYLHPAEYSGKEFDLISLGADGIRGGENENADIFNWKPNENPS